MPARRASALKPTHRPANFIVIEAGAAAPGSACVICAGLNYFALWLMKLPPASPSQHDISPLLVPEGS